MEELRDDIDDLPTFNHAPDNFEQLYDSDLDLLLDDDVAGNAEDSEEPEFSSSS